MISLATETEENLKQATADDGSRDRNSHGSAADMSLSREELRRVLSARSLNQSSRAAAKAAPQRTLTAREEQAVLILRHAMEYLMDGVPMGGPHTVFADIQHSDMQAAAILARASREFFVPTTESLPQTPSRVGFREWLRGMAVHLGLLHQEHSA